jgi:DNA replication protein DnaC
MTRIEWLERLVGHRLLIIDEVGKGLERIEREILPYIVNVFYNDQKKILIMTGNETAENFRGIIGESGADRFCESGVMLSLCGESYRKNKRSMV